MRCIDCALNGVDPECEPIPEFDRIERRIPCPWFEPREEKEESDGRYV